MTELKARFGLALLAVIAAVGLAACDDTIRGAATDIQQTTNAIEDSTQPQPQGSQY
jgi:predicted small secreted protein